MAERAARSFPLLSRVPSAGGVFRSHYGKQLQLALDRAGITANRNAIPFDTLSPALTSGLRLGTAAATTRGFGLDEMAKIADWIDRVAADVEDDEAIAKVRAEITELCRAIPLYPDMY